VVDADVEEVPTMKLELQQDALNAAEDPGGRWLFEGGRAFDANGNQVGHYAGTLRVVFGGTEAQNAAMLTMTILALGAQPPESLTVQGVHDFNTGNESGSVSAASGQFAPLIGHPFSRVQRTVTID
jgi:hypothetical protein